MNRIGIFGGTFNPIHLGHLRSAEEIRELFGLDKVFFVPTSDPPHKDKTEILAGSFRAQMIRLAIADHSAFFFSDLELQRPGKSYSFETIQAFRRSFSRTSALYFILGLDAFLEISTWKKYLSLFELCHFIVMTRPGFGKKFTRKHLPVELSDSFCYDTREKCYIHSSGYGLFPREITALDISSSQIRRLIQQGRSIRFLVPSAVEKLIREKKFYHAKEVDPPA